MELVKVEVSLPKESHELAKMLAKVAKVIIEAGKDGFKADDVMPIVSGMFEALSGEGLKGLDQLPKEIKEDPAKFALALVVELDSVL